MSIRFFIMTPSERQFSFYYYYLYIAKADILFSPKKLLKDLGKDNAHAVFCQYDSVIFEFILEKQNNMAACYSMVIFYSKS